MGDDSDDLDRSAILARRQRFIAMALSGLAVSCGEAGPVPCLDVGPVSTSSGPGDGTTATTTGDDSTSTSGSTMGTGESRGASSDTGGDAADTSSGDGGATTGGSDTGGSDSTGRPMPCLGVLPDDV